MGLGKTVIVLTAFEELYSAGKTGALLVVAPLRVAETVWDVEVKDWAHTRKLKVLLVLGGARHRAQTLTQKADIYVINIDNVAWLANILYTMQQQGRKIPFDWLVVDESSMFKANSTQRFKAIRALLPAFERRVILTGRPSPNSRVELWPQMYILDQGASLGYNRATYLDRYFYKNIETGRYELKPGAENRIAEAIGHLVLRMDNKELKDMPKIIENEIRIVLPTKARSQYDRLEREMFIRIDELLETERRTGIVRAVNMAVLVGKCHQIANGAVFDSEQRDTYHEVHEAKIDALEETLDELGGNALIAYGYRHDRERIQKRLGPLPVIGGGSKNKVKQLLEDWNAGRHRAMLVHPKSAMYGLNMQEGGHDIIWFSNVFSLEMHDQLIGRLARSGQKSPYVTSHHLVASATTDEAMRGTIRRKAYGQLAQLNALKEYQSTRNL